MHFHWDDFDGLLGRIFAFFGPPLLNLALVVLLLSSFLYNITIDMGADIVKDSTEVFRSFLEDKDVSPDTSRLEVFRLVLQEANSFLKTELNLDLKAAWSYLQKPTISAVVGTLLWLGILAAVFVFVLDVVVRAIGWLLPLRVVLRDHTLVKHHTLDDVFDLMMLKIHAAMDFAQITDQEKDLVISRYHLWLGIRNQLDERQAAVRYHKARDAMMARLKWNKTWFSYLRGHLILSVGAAYVLGSFGPLFLTIFYGAALFAVSYQQFLLGRDLVQNDVETFFALPECAAGDILVLEPQSPPAPHWTKTLESIPPWVAWVWTRKT